MLATRRRSGRESVEFDGIRERCPALRGSRVEQEVLLRADSEVRNDQGQQLTQNLDHRAFGVDSPEGVRQQTEAWGEPGIRGTFKDVSDAEFLNLKIFKVREDRRNPTNGGGAISRLSESQMSQLLPPPKPADHRHGSLRMELESKELFGVLGCQRLLDVRDPDSEKSPDPDAGERAVGPESFDGSSRDTEPLGGLIDGQCVLGGLRSVVQRALLPIRGRIPVSLHAVSEHREPSFWW